MIGVRCPFLSVKLKVLYEDRAVAGVDIAGERAVRKSA